MTGMKEGAGEDPFAEEQETENQEEEIEDIELETSSDQNQNQGQQQVQIPYKFRRDGVQDSRDRVPLFLMDSTKREERDALRELEEQFNDNVSTTDLREAAVIAGLKNLDEVKEQLEEWGYGMTFD